MSCLGDLERGRGDLWQVNLEGYIRWWIWRVSTARHFGGSVWRVCLAGLFGGSSLVLVEPRREKRTSPAVLYTVQLYSNM